MLLAFTLTDEDRAVWLKEVKEIQKNFYKLNNITNKTVEKELNDGIEVYRSKKNLDIAAKKFEKALRYARLVCTKRHLEARILANYATVLRDMGKYQVAILHYRLSLLTCIQLKHLDMERKVLSALSICCMEARKYNDARVYVEHLLQKTELPTNRHHLLARLETIKLNCA